MSAGRPCTIKPEGSSHVTFITFRLHVITICRISTGWSCSYRHELGAMCFRVTISTVLIHVYWCNEKIVVLDVDAGKGKIILRAAIEKEEGRIFKFVNNVKYQRRAHTDTHEGTFNLLC